VSRRAAILLALAAALALPAATAAKATPCAADQRLVDAWRKVLAANSKITVRQTVILQEMLRRTSNNQPIPRELTDELRSLVNKNRTQLAAGERRIVLIKPGTANGRELKRLVLRFIRDVARPLNSCIGKFLVADTPEELQDVVTCVDASSRARVALSHSIDKSLAKVRTTRSPCAKR
jgi:hypothetical protein